MSAEIRKNSMQCTQWTDTFRTVTSIIFSTRLLSNVHSVQVHMTLHHIGGPTTLANVKIVIELKFVIEVKWG